MKLLRFFVIHSLRDMWRNRSRTVFALVCVATGVSAVVALRSLAFMIADELTSDLAEMNRGDIRVYASNDVPEIASSSSGVNITFNREGERTIREWAREEQVEVTTAYLAGLTPMKRVTAGQAEAPKPVLPLFIEPNSYPFYSTIIVDNGKTLAEAFPRSASEAGAAGQEVLPKLGAVGGLAVPSWGNGIGIAWGSYPVFMIAHPRPIVISSNLMRQSGLGLRVGDVVQIGASDTVYVVSGTVPPSSESVLSNPQTVFFDFVYLPITDLPLHDRPALPDQIFIKVPLGRDITSVEESLLAHLITEFPRGTDFAKELNRATVPELEEQNADTADVIDKMILVMGLSSLLIGGIGIINTMLVVVSRRTLEIAVLKTLGLKGYRVTTLFLVEALLLGLIGSLLGVGVGIGLSYLIKDVGESALKFSLVWRVYPEAVVSGMFLGLVITALFGFLPTLVAGQVRPAIVLRPNEAQMPPAGLLQVLITLIVMIVVLGLLVDTIVEGVVSVSPVYMMFGAGALVGLFTGVILGNSKVGQPIPDYYQFPRLPAITPLLRGLRQFVLLFGSLSIGAAVASGIILIVSEIWLPAGIGDSKPANDVIGALRRGEVAWAGFWLVQTVSIGIAIRLRAQALVGMIALGSVGTVVGGLLGWLAGIGMKTLFDGTEAWDSLSELSTGVVLVEGGLALLCAVFIGYWLLVWVISRMPGSVLMAIVSLTLLLLTFSTLFALSMLSAGILFAVVIGALIVMGLMLWMRRPVTNTPHQSTGQSSRTAARGTPLVMVSAVLVAGGLMLSDAAGQAGRWGGVSLLAIIFFGLWLRLKRRYSVDARLILREMAGRRMRTASTLLGLSVGLAGLSLIALTTGAASNLLEIQFEERAEGNLLVVAQLPSQRETIRNSLSELEGVDHFSQYTTFGSLLLEVNGEPVEMHNFDQDMTEEEDPRENSNFEVPSEGASVFLSERDDLGALPDYRMVSGRKFTPADVGKPYILVRESFFTQRFDIKAGDELLLKFENGIGPGDDVQLSLEVVGVIEQQSEQTGFGDRFMVPVGTLPTTVRPTGIFTIAQVDESNDVYMDNALIAMSEVPGVLAIELSDLTRLIENLMEQLKAIPTLVAWLALVAGTAIIANTVALATQERRRQIGVMKAVGLKGRRVLVMLMIENGLIGLLAGLIGVLVGLLLTVVLVLASESPDDLERAIEFSSILWLVIMSIGVAVGAALLSAWSAAAEKPMNVLRYE